MIEPGIKGQYGCDRGSIPFTSPLQESTLISSTNDLISKEAGDSSSLALKGSNGYPGADRDREWVDRNAHLVASGPEFLTYITTVPTGYYRDFVRFC